MKNKGFTLIELLAVIVILAIIALIATPMILSVIEKAKKGAAESSALGYIDAVEKQVMINEMDSATTNITTKTTETYSVTDLKKIGVTVKGDEPIEGSVTIENGNVTDYSLKFKDYTVTKENGKITTKKNEKVEEITYETYSNGNTIYYNPTAGEKCKESEAVSTTGTKNGCMKWYAFNDEEGSTSVNLILDHNTTAEVAWNSSGSNSEMKEVATALEMK